MLKLVSTKTSFYETSCNVRLPFRDVYYWLLTGETRRERGKIKIGIFHAKNREPYKKGIHTNGNSRQDRGECSEDLRYRS